MPIRSLRNQPPPLALSLCHRWINVFSIVCGIACWIFISPLALSCDKPSCTSSRVSNDHDVAQQKPTSGMQVYLSPVTGKPIGPDHPERVDQIEHPTAALSRQVASPQTELPQVTPSVENTHHRSSSPGGGSFIFAGPQQRSMIHGTLNASGKLHTQCEASTDAFNHTPSHNNR